MKKQTISRKELYDLVWSTPFLTLAKTYAISDVGLKKICVKMGIPTPKSGHWAKVQFNKEVDIIKLPENYSGTNEATLNLRDVNGPVFNGIQTHNSVLQKEIILKEGKNLHVPERLINPCDLVMKAQEILTKSNFPERGLIRTNFKGLNIAVSKENIGRALRFFNTFIKIMEDRGHSVFIDWKCTIALVLGEKIIIHLSEKVIKVPKPTNHSWQEYDYLPTGILMFNAKVCSNTNTWKDGKFKIEDKLARIIAWFDLKGEELRKEKIEREMSWEQQREIRRIEEERQKRIEKELNDFHNLLNQCERWHKAELLRNFLDHVEIIAKKNDNYSDETKEWLKWAHAKADWYDSIVATKDDFLGFYDKDGLFPLKDIEEEDNDNIVGSNTQDGNLL